MTSSEIRTKIDELAHQARIEWEAATQRAKEIEQEIQRLSVELENQQSFGALRA